MVPCVLFLSFLLPFLFFFSSSLGYISDELPITSPYPLQYLDGEEWILSNTDNTVTVQGIIPGDLVSDLSRNGLLPSSSDPLYELTWLTDSYVFDLNNWTYTRNFDVTNFNISLTSDVLLVFESVKMPADIYLNNQHIGYAVNQFIRYTYSIGNLLQTMNNTLSITFSDRNDIRTDTTGDRFAADSGGWDWVFYSNLTTGTTPGGIRQFNKGILKSVYLVPVPIMEQTCTVLTYLVPLTFYQSSYPTDVLTPATQGTFLVNVTTHFYSSFPTTGKLTVTGSWGASLTQSVSLPIGPSSYTVSLIANANEYELWWPNTLGNHPLYTVNASYQVNNGLPVTISRIIGFRVIALVTDNDSNPSSLQNITGTGSLTLRLKVNGANMVIRGSNWVPTDTLESRISSQALYRTVQSMADAGMHVLRIWGGGLPPYTSFLDAADQYGIMLMIDQMYSDQADSYHMALQTIDQDTELRHTIRRSASHPSIVLYDGCNECGGSGLFESFVMTTVAEEDNSRPPWPSSPSDGWMNGVDRLYGLPTGTGLKIITASSSFSVQSLASSGHFTPINDEKGQIRKDLVSCDEYFGTKSSSTVAVTCTAQPGGNYHGFPVSTFWIPIPVSSAQECCELCANTTGCIVALYAIPPFFLPGCQLKGALGGDPVPVYQEEITALWPNTTNWNISAIPLVPSPPSLEQHGPYTGGGGAPAVSGGAGIGGISVTLPSKLPAITNYGTNVTGIFTSEFGSVSFSSFESLAPTLAPSHWGISGGLPVDTCDPRGFWHPCNGTNPLSQRNYPCVNFWYSYYGSLVLPSGLSINSTGVEEFRAQLYLCQLASSLQLKQLVEQHRAENIWGLVTWMAEEIWPVLGGWGSIEYTNPVGTPGQVLGGRWKTTHYWLMNQLFRDIFITCGDDLRCYVRNDNPVSGLKNAYITLILISLQSSTAPVTLLPFSLVNLPRGGNSMYWFCANNPNTSTCNGSTWNTILSSYGCSSTGNDCILRAQVYDSTQSTVLASNDILFTIPGNLLLSGNRCTTTTPATATADTAKENITMVMNNNKTTATYVTYLVADSINNDGTINITVTSLNGVSLYVTFTTLAHGRFTDNGFNLLTNETRLLVFYPFTDNQYDELRTTLRIDYLNEYVDTTGCYNNKPWSKR